MRRNEGPQLSRSNAQTTSVSLQPFKGGREGCLVRTLGVLVLAGLAALPFSIASGAGFRPLADVALGLLLAAVFNWVFFKRVRWEFSEDEFAQVTLGRREKDFKWSAVDIATVHSAGGIASSSGAYPVVELRVESRPRSPLLAFRPGEMSEGGLRVVVNELLRRIPSQSVDPKFLILWHLVSPERQKEEQVVGQAEWRESRAFAQRMRLGRARHALERLMSEQTSQAHAATTLYCEVLLMLGEYEEAVRASDGAGPGDESGAWTSLCRAVGWSMLGRPQQALETLETLVCQPVPGGPNRDVVAAFVRRLEPR